MLTIDRFADAVVFVVIRSYSSIVAERQGKGQRYFLRVSGSCLSFVGDSDRKRQSCIADIAALPVLMRLQARLTLSRMYKRLGMNKAQPDRAPYFSYLPDEPEKLSELNRLTFGAIAQRAGIPYAFALDAQQHGLVRADQGRGTG